MALRRARSGHPGARRAGVGDRVRSPRAWLRVVIRRQLSRLVQRTGREEPLLDLDAVDSPVDLAERIRRSIDLDRLLQRVSARDRRLLTLALSGRSHAQIGSLMGIREGAVGAHLARARERARRCFDTLSGVCRRRGRGGHHSPASFGNATGPYHGPASGSSSASHPS
jgi:DNA-directed RNA polymerase specialized sigma24 family protein